METWWSRRQAWTKPGNIVPACQPCLCFPSRTLLLGESFLPCLGRSLGKVFGRDLIRGDARMTLAKWLRRLEGVVPVSWQVRTLNTTSSCSEAGKQCHPKSYHNLARNAPISSLSNACNCYANGPQHITQAGNEYFSSVLHKEPRGPRKVACSHTRGINWAVLLKLFLCFCIIWRMEPRVLYIVGKYLTVELYSPCKFYFETGSHCT